KALSAWNRIHPDEALRSDDRTRMHAAATASAQEAQDSISFISGVTYGSSFVGMVHFLKTSGVRTGVDEKMAGQIRERLQVGGWLEHASGGFGVDEETLNEVRKILSLQNVSAHISMIVSGALPSIASNEVKLGIGKIAQPAPRESIDLLTQIDE